MKKMVSKTTGKIANYRRLAQNTINRNIKAGKGDLMREILGSLDVNELVKSKKGFENFKRKMKVVHQRPYLEKDKEKRKEEKEKKDLIKKAKKISKEQVGEVIDVFGHKAYCDMYYEGKMGALSQFDDFDDMKIDELKEAIHDMVTVPLIVHAEMLKEEKIERFFHNYLREIELNEIEGKQIDALKESFKGEKISEFNDFQAIVTSDKFKGHDYNKNDADGYQDVMTSRLKRMLEMRGIKTDKKGNVIK